MKGRNDEECHNYIRVLSPESSTNRTLICGTNSFKPKCRLIDGIMREEAGNIFQFSGIGIVPYDPSFESTFIRDGDELYTSSGIYNKYIIFKKKNFLFKIILCYC